MLQIISWNILQGGGSRTLGIMQLLSQANFQIAILSEFRNNANGKRLLQLLDSNGFKHQLVSGAHADDNSVCIASKLPFQPIVYLEADTNFTHNIITAQFEAFNVMGLYLPHKKKHQLLPFITNLVSSTSTPYIIAGDYNTGHNFIDQKGDSFWYQSELKALEATGYLDAYRLLHGSLETYSWFSHQGNGFRYDHTYIHPDLKPIVKKCYYMHEVRQLKLSDHSAMVLELG